MNVHISLYLLSFCHSMAVSRMVKINLGEPEDQKDLSLMEKWRRHVEEKKKSGQDAKVGICLITTLLSFQIPSQLVMFVYYIIPTLFIEYSPWVQYYLKVLVMVGCLEFTANYLCVRLYDTVYRTTRDNPQPKEILNRWNNPPEKFEPLLGHSNGMANGHMTDDHGSLPWTHCEKCNMNIPPRTHHCDFCKACVLKRDHHCFMVGTCIGHKNQRYFVVVAFWTMMCGLFGALFTFVYVSHIHWPFAPWTDFFLPVTVYRTLWSDKIPLHIGIMILHLHLECMFGFLGFFYFISQMLIIAQGKTLHELAKEVPVKNFNSVNSNFVSVFGNFWALNFIFPMQILFPQTDDGIKWEGVKLDYNANCEKSVKYNKKHGLLKDV